MGLRPNASVATARRGVLASEFRGVDGHVLPAQIAAELERLVAYADSQERKVSQLQSALDSRVVIERAIGILAERFALPLAGAFELLRTAARNTRREVRTIAEELSASRQTPPEIAELLPKETGLLLTLDGESAELPRCPQCGTRVA